MSKINPQPYYRLRELIYAKYSEAKFALGCEITARWVAHETRATCTMEQVQIWCNILIEDFNSICSHDDSHAIERPQEWLISLKQSQSIIKLFGIKSEYSLFNLKPTPNEQA